MHVTSIQIEVRYAETDQMGVVHHSNYLVWMEMARNTLIKELGLNYVDMEKAGYVSPIIDVNVSYKSPCRYGETVEVKTWIEEYNGLITTFGYEIVNGKGEISLTGTSRHVCVKKDNFRPVPLRRAFPDWHSRYEEAKKQ